MIHNLNLDDRESLAVTALQAPHFLLKKHIATRLKETPSRTMLPSFASFVVCACIGAAMVLSAAVAPVPPVWPTNFAVPFNYSYNGSLSEGFMLYVCLSLFELRD